MNRELVFRFALLLTVLGLAAQSQPDPNAFSLRDILGGMAELANWTVQMVRDPNARPLVATLALGIAVAAVFPRQRAPRRRSRH